MKQETITFNYPPTVTREYVKNWLEHARNTATPEQIATLEDVLKLIDVAVRYLTPGKAPKETDPAEPETK